MKKYIFTESQVKKIINSQVNEQVMNTLRQTNTLADMDYPGISPEFANLIRTKGTFKVINGDFGFATLNDKPAHVGAIITPQTKITLGMSSSIVMSGMHLPEAGINFGQNKLEFVKQVA
jgi:hypothetical protein